MPESISEFLRVEQAKETSQKILDVLTNAELQEKLLPLKVAFIVFIFLFSVIIIYLFLKTSLKDWGRLEAVKEFSQTSPFFAGKSLTRKWKKIKKGAESDSEPQRKLSLIKAHNLLNDILTARGYAQETLAEKLKTLTPEQVSSLDELQGAAQVCGDILKDPDYRLEKEQAKEVSQAFGRALVDLELL